MADRLAAAPTRAVALTKWLVNRSLRVEPDQSFEEEAYAQELVSATGDMAEGMTAFVERRAPEFKGW